MQWISIEHARSRHMGDTLALLRLGSHCALLDGVTARPVAVYEHGIHSNRLPHVPPTATFDELGRALDSPDYYKIRLSPDRIRDFAPLRLDQLARHLSLWPVSSDPMSREHVVQRLQRAYATGSFAGLRERRRGLRLAARRVIDASLYTNPG